MAVDQMTALLMFSIFSALVLDRHDDDNDLMHGKSRESNAVIYMDAGNIFAWTHDFPRHDSCRDKNNKWKKNVY